MPGVPRIYGEVIAERGTASKITTLASVAACAFAVLAPQVGCAQSPDEWQFEATVYAYLPAISGHTTFPPTDGGGDVSIDASKIFGRLQFAFMGALDVRKGAWGAFTDIIHLDAGESRSGDTATMIGNVSLPVGVAADTHLDFKASLWTLAGTRRVVDSPANFIDVLAGFRMIDLSEAIDWQLTGNVGPIQAPDRSGARDLHAQDWDAIVGFRGRASLGQARRWFIPYEFDVGTGESDFTLQAMAGVGYAYGWGNVSLAWRILDYQMKSGKGIEDLRLSGPGLAVQFQW